MGKLTIAKIRALEKQVKQISKKNKPKIVPNDWEEFVKLCTIRSGGIMTQFQPYPYQRLLVNLMKFHRNIIIVKSRQLGTTQGIVSKFLHDASLNAASSSACFMRNGDDVGSLSRRIKQMLQGLKDYVCPANDSVGYIKLRSLGDIYIKNSSREGIRSLDSITNQLYDEAAFVDNIEQIYGASSAASALVGELVTKLIVSTPSAKMGWYWNKLSENNDFDIEHLCKEVAEGRLWRDVPGLYYFIDNAGVLKVILHWRCHPVYSQINKEYPGGYLAYRMKQDNTDEEIILREYDLRFIDSSVAVFTSDLIRDSAIGNWEEFRDNKAEYFIGVDTSTLGGDYCVAIVIKKKDFKYYVVWMYRKKQQTSEYNLYEISKLIDRYKPDKIAIEHTGGVGVLYTESLSKEFPGYEFEGIKTTGDSKPAMISGLQLALEKRILIHPNSAITTELLSFRRSGNKLEASNGHNDDTVMALSFSLLVATKTGQLDLSLIPT